MKAIIGIVMDGDRFLTITRSQFVRAPGWVCFPGGEIEPGESEPAALAREFREELNVQADGVERVWRSQSPSGTQLNWWTANLLDQSATVLENPGQLPIDPNLKEVESVAWMTREELLETDQLLASNRAFFEAIDSQPNLAASLYRKP